MFVVSKAPVDKAPDVMCMREKLGGHRHKGLGLSTSMYTSLEIKITVLSR
jgi:hypothetical protein